MVQNLLTTYVPTLLATLIEPAWVLVNRILCLLQPLEELRSSKASVTRSLTINYTSLPPQLVVFRALYSGNILLAVVCAMALLSNLLATSFSGLFLKDGISMLQESTFQPLLHAQFVSINGLSGPIRGIGVRSPLVNNASRSGAFQGGFGEDQFLILESNYTRKTTLIPWLGTTAAYIPFKKTEEDEQGLDLQAQTLYFTAAPRCTPLAFGIDYKIVHGRRQPKFFKVSVPNQEGVKTTCQVILDYKTAKVACSEHRSAAELVYTLEPEQNATKVDREACMTSALIGWMRAEQANCTREYYGEWQSVNAENTFLMLCQPELEVGTAHIRVNANGTLLDEATNIKPDPDQSQVALAKYCANGCANVIGQSNLFIFRMLITRWHNDSYASECLHYFINRARGDLRLTDPEAPLPMLSDIQQAIEIAYRRLFATWLAVNRDLLFQPARNDSPSIKGHIIVQEERLFLNFSMFVIAETILCIYIIVAVILIVRRPGRYLSRMPTSIATVIALFAASAAVKDLRNTYRMTNKERIKHLDSLGHQYGYGSYIGDDGAVHVGIEKAPYVQRLKDVTFEGIGVNKAKPRSYEEVNSNSDEHQQLHSDPQTDADVADGERAV